jgi:hypothetical protein
MTVAILFLLSVVDPEGRYNPFKYGFGNIAAIESIIEKQAVNVHWFPKWSAFNICDFKS